jgi:predicted SAM-dependent methyltransferase
MANIQSQKLSLINLGCGTRFHPDWVNIDKYPVNQNVIPHDLRQSLPFTDNIFDVVYHSHVLEHFSRTEGKIFLRECFRICKPGGIIRIVVPDLENIVRSYLHALEEGLSGNPEAEERYNWMMLELFDQAVRTRPGGDMALYVQNASLDLQAFISSRMGHHLIDEIRNFSIKRKRVLFSITKLTGKNILNKIREKAFLWISFILYGKSGLMITNEVYTRLSGEIHQWMYDRYSLRQVLNEVGFINYKIFTAVESNIRGWQGFNLDSDPDGSIYKPDSLYCEAFK